MKKTIIWLLKLSTQLILKKYKPIVVAITGSVGKTSTKEAIYTVLQKKYNTRRSTSSFNNEIGVPLTVIGVDSPGKNILGWFKILFKVFNLVLFKTDYPEVLVIEMGADHPGDIYYLTSFIPIDVGVLTAIAPVHLEFFKTIENILKEKQILIEMVKKDGAVVINGDDWMVRQSIRKTKSTVYTFGIENTNTVKAVEVKLSTGNDHNKQEISGLSFKLIYRGNSVPIFLPGVLGKHQVYVALAAAAVGLSLDCNLVEIADALQRFKSPKGRMNLIIGIKDTIIIDDTYNSSPAAAKAALEVLAEIPTSGKGRKLAVFGDMLELGNYTEQGHREVGHKTAELNIDFLLCVGEKSRDIGRGAKEAGMGEERIYYFSDNDKVVDFLKRLIKKNDVILVKGSQGTRMEKVVKAIMVNPENAKLLLVRQDKSWVK